ncbi:hypothetical protein D6855_09560 [Butyrivibrio sp. CB08]|uniref:Acg family FMN-binding oxidoreductase n=1 Tax=Butyrivibrio sp. CB08 TaxID=2364879 RepID=UPI000EA9A76B|nr:hypothetical protein [Butyrivibrio sp. CB08]RKM59148.1 hypothetical protein D6855_09560 [Butyrivibrio sp. CB08]
MKIRIIILLALFISTVATALWLGSRKVDVNTDKTVEGLSEELQEVFYLAALAPSSHNIQSWVIDVDPEKEIVEIQVDPERKLSVVDPEGREMYISLGCYTETLTRAFGAYGYQCKTEYDSFDKKMVVTYKKSSETVDEYEIELIKKRHTEKAPFDRTLLIPDDFLLAAIDDADICYYRAGSEEYDTIKEATAEAYEKQAYDEKVASELSEWLRLSEDEAIDYKDGLPAEQLGLKGIKKAIYYLFTDHESAKGDSFAKQGIDNTDRQLEGCNCFVTVSAGDDEEALIDCGKETVRFWLQMTARGVSVQPMSYVLEDRETRAHLTKAINLSQYPQMLLRVGYVKNYGANAGIRRDLKDYIRVK